MNVGDKILILVHGPHGTGLVKAEVEHIYESGGAAVKVGETSTVSTGFRDDQEGTVWTRGHDPTTPEAAAMLVAAALS